MKRLVYLLTACLGIMMMTSCLGSSDDDVTLTGQGYFKASDSNGGSFVTKNLTLILSPESKTLIDFTQQNGNLFYLDYRKVVTKDEKVEKNILHNVNINQYYPLNGPVYVTSEGTEVNGLKNEEPFLTLSGNNVPKSGFYDRNTLILTVDYEFRNLKHLHNIYLVFDKSQQKSGSIVVNLCNYPDKDVKDDTKETYSLGYMAMTTGNFVIMQKAFRLEKVYEAYKVLFPNDKLPDTVTVKYNTKEDGGSDEKLKEEIVTVKYEENTTDKNN